MTQYPNWRTNNANSRSLTPDSSGVRTIKIDLSVARSAELGNLFVWQQKGLYLRNAADNSAGGAQVSVDAGSNEKTLGRNNFYLAVGDAINYPYSRVTVANDAQPGRFLYLESASEIELHPQSITDLLNTAGSLRTRRVDTAEGWVDYDSITNTIPGQGTHADTAPYFMRDLLRTASGGASAEKMYAEELAKEALIKDAAPSSLAVGQNEILENLAPSNNTSSYIYLMQNDKVNDLLSISRGTGNVRDTLYKTSVLVATSDTSTTHDSPIPALTLHFFIAGFHVKVAASESEIFGTNSGSDNGQEAGAYSVFNLPPFIVPKRNANPAVGNNSLLGIAVELSKPYNYVSALRISVHAFGQAYYIR